MKPAAALRYAAHGWRVLPIWPVVDGSCGCARVPPCGTPGKHPIERRGVFGASSVARQVEHWLELYPGCSWGIATGRPGPVVLDVDPRNGGGEALAALVEAHGPLPRTLTVRTGGGGLHFYFADPGGPAGLSRKLGPGLDYQARGKYVVAPPSSHASGARYRWESARGTGLAALPTWLAALVSRADERPMVEAAAVHRGAGRGPSARARAVAYLATMPPSISGQRGHAALWLAALAVVRGFALDQGEAFDVLAEHFNPRCLPPWTPGEIWHKVRSAGRSKAPLGYLL